MIRFKVCRSSAREGVARFLTFAFVGSVGTAIQYAVLGSGVSLDIATPVACSAAGYALGSVANYLLNYRFTFQSQVPHIQAATKYFSVLAAGWVLNLCLMSLFVVVIGWSPWKSQILTTAFGLVWNYTGSQRWAFDPSRTTGVRPNATIHAHPKWTRYALKAAPMNDAPNVAQNESYQVGAPVK